MIYDHVFFLLCFVLCCAGDQFEDECGLEAADTLPLVWGGLEGLKANQFPWQVAIFHKRSNRFQAICGGSLVRSNLVISAAHCFSDRAHSHQVNVADYRVVGGTRLSSWNSTEIGRQQSEVREVRLGEGYGGNILSYENDISIVQLTTAFTFSDTVRAVCLDLEDTALNARQTSPGSTGMVAGWGLTESGAPSDSLKFLRVPVVSREDCLETLPFNFKSFFTSDKICAGFTNGSAVCQGDSGGGLVFPQNVSTNLQRWYLRGVVSNTLSTQSLKNQCLTDSFALYTDIFKHKMWLSTKMVDILPQGAGCRVRGSAGVCRNITDCPLATEELLLGILPQLCSSSGPEICCEKPSCPPLPPVAKTTSKAYDYCTGLVEKMLLCQKNGSDWIRGPLCGTQPDLRAPGYRMVTLSKASPSEVQRYALVEILPVVPAIHALLISERWLLTTAAAMDVIRTLPGGNYSSTALAMFTISRRVPHPLFKNSEFVNNLELLEMDKEVIFSRSLLPVCLHTSLHSIKDLTLTRWGMTRPAALLSQKKCGKLFPPGSVYAPDGVTDGHMCLASPLEEGCLLYYENHLAVNNTHMVACTKLLVGMYLGYDFDGRGVCNLLHLRVAHYVPWVESVVWPS